MTEPSSAKLIRSLFVDEAGDLTFFDRRGKVIVGREGVSRCFIVGAAEIIDPAEADNKLRALRAELLANPYFAGVPSMQQSAKKTALAFHAKDDLPEVRFRVFELLRTLNVKVFVAIRRKDLVADELTTHLHHTGKRLSVDSVYDDLVTRIFRDKLHNADENRIVFAMRRTSDRNAALTAAIAKAKQSFARKWRKDTDRPTHITSGFPHQYAGLQIVDYYLWALQRFIERSEPRFYNLLAPHYRLIIDVDDSRKRGYGEYYTAANPLTPEKLMPIT